MNDITTTPLTSAFGVRIDGLSLERAAKGEGFATLRGLFEDHSALLLRNQTMTDDIHLALARQFGEVEDRLADERKPGEKYEVPKVSNVRADGSVTGEMDLHTLNLKANMLWHADSTFLPRPALTNILIARVVTSSGGATELASTRAAWAEMPEALKARIRGRGIWHAYSHSRAQIAPELAKMPMFHKWPDQHWKSVWTNPENGHEALYIASHAYQVDGYSKEESKALLDELMEFCTQDQFTYAHNWRVGDVLIWDQRAVLHRATPWPYEEPRTLSSLCVTVSDADGLSDMALAAS
ncbi:TauD/TfdA dioxygenase family protein [Sulfitobacter aestuariivivens]|uniref:TauD/TfdA family dioxygenase n=1 Tax=Sulfitobacter aestuariivivens TaxID=2766981 RepID=A0A927D567_9RHOB|nr:TauD/TfdA family dioxygenase [Sulfitobacter aestuariivivens]MBD3665343.1 TauD/TfdA family dioxygenase [Sulfitobacter aestuariivivens]